MVVTLVQTRIRNERRIRASWEEKAKRPEETLRRIVVRAEENKERKGWEGGERRKRWWRIEIGGNNVWCACIDDVPVGMEYTRTPHLYRFVFVARWRRPRRPRTQRGCKPAGLAASQVPDT